ncbi:MAG: hypothetical protein U9Q80_07580 [Bacillota bacterium]|nr:hypothetical protein [Bacillota bacterium]
MLKLGNLLKGFEKQVENADIRIDEIKRNLKQAEEEFKKLFVHKEKLKAFLIQKRVRKYLLRRVKKNIFILF